MQEIFVGKNEAGQRLDRFLKKTLPALLSALLQKYIRTKRIKCNGQRCLQNQRLAEGDVLQVYIGEESFERSNRNKLFLDSCCPRFSVLYEDENLLLADRPPGMPVQSEGAERGHTLIAHIQAYLYQKREWMPESENSFAPALCNRIDQNTGGIVIAAKNAEAFRILTDKIQSREITKKYLCVVLGRIAPSDGRLEYFLLKNERKKQMDVYRRPVSGGRTAVTLYRTLINKGELSLMEAELLTGRTHQIRVSFAEAGHPLLGDGKYGCWEMNRRYGETRQALYSYYLRFAFPTDAGILEYLRGKEFRVKQVPFVETYFPEKGVKSSDYYFI